MEAQTYYSGQKKNFLEKLFGKEVRIPTQRQIETWEDDGGSIQWDDESLVIINGVVCESVSDRLKAKLSKYLS